MIIKFMLNEKEENPCFMIDHHHRYDKAVYSESNPLIVTFDPSCSPASGHQAAAASVCNEVCGEDAHATVVRLPLPPVVLRLGPGGDGDAVAGAEAQVAGLLTGEGVGRRDDQRRAGSAH